MTLPLRIGNGTARARLSALVFCFQFYLAPIGLTLLIVAAIAVLGEPG